VLHEEFVLLYSFLMSSCALFVGLSLGDFCGDGQVTTHEQCNDGNLESGMVAIGCAYLESLLSVARGSMREMRNVMTVIFALTIRATHAPKRMTANP
jgi:cysteine-rich repeat protein